MHRHKMVMVRSAVSNQLQAIAINRGIRKKSGLWAQKGWEQSQSLPPFAEKSMPTPRWRACHARRESRLCADCLLRREQPSPDAR